MDEKSTPCRPNLLAEAWSRFRSLLGQPVDAASLAVLRIGFGLIMVWEVFEYLRSRPTGVTKLELLYSSKHWHVPYHGFEWLKPWAEPWMTVHFVLLGIAGLLVALGLFYRWAAAAMFVLFTSFFLMDATNYLNHFYLMCLISFLFICVPAQRCFSIESWWKRRKQGLQNATAEIPFWCIFLFRFQLFVIYFYAAIAKLGADWLGGDVMIGRGHEIVDFLANYLTLPSFVNAGNVSLFMGWGGLVFDACIGFMLLIPRTRLLGILLMGSFHGMNHIIFPIGVFPAMAFTSSLIFLDPDWPRRFWAWIRKPQFVKPNLPWLVGGGLILPGLGAALGWKLGRGLPRSSQNGKRAPVLVALAIAVWMTFHCLFPLRNFVIPGHSNWTEEGHRFSWRMMLRGKSSYNLKFFIRDDALIRKATAGQSEFNWDAWPKDQPRVMFADLDSHRIQWNHLPEVVCIYDPYIGVRVIGNTSAVGSSETGSQKKLREQIRQKWHSVYGRTPVIEESIELSDALDAIHAYMRSLEDVDRDFLAEQLDRLEEAQQIVANANRTPKDMVKCCDLIWCLLAWNPHGEVVRAHLSRVHPFAIQGRPDPDKPFLIVSDPGLPKPDVWHQFHKLHDGHPYVALVDIGRLRPSGWEQLPEAVVYQNRGTVNLVWNFSREMHLRHTRKLSINPYMIHQYAQRVAEHWESRTGRRPRVHVSSLVQLNQRIPQLMIDPEVDLASASIKMFSNNSWIKPLKDDAVIRREIAEAKKKMAQARAAAAEIPRTWSITARYDDGTRKEGVHRYQDKAGYALAKWYPDGRISFFAEYRNNQLHGRVAKWHPDGTVAAKAMYADGKPVEQQQHAVRQASFDDAQLK